MDIDVVVVGGDGGDVGDADGNGGGDDEMGVFVYAGIFFVAVSCLLSVLLTCKVYVMDGPAEAIYVVLH